MPRLSTWADCRANLTQLDMLRFLPVLLLLIIIAAIMRDDFALTLVYLCLGAILAGAWWSRRSLSQIEGGRKMDAHTFLGEKILVRLKIPGSNGICGFDKNEAKLAKTRPRELPKCLNDSVPKKRPSLQAL